MNDRDTLGTLLIDLLDRTPAALVSADAMTTIVSMAAEMAPIFCGGIECRLAGHTPQVDLHQCIPAGDNHPRLLASHIRRHPILAGHPAWSALSRLCDAWETPGTPPARCIDELWLELDAGDSDNPLLAPAVFASFGRMAETGATEAEATAAVRTASHLLRVPMPPAALDMVRRLPKGIRITHAGWMMSRPGSPIRFNLAGMPPRDITATLRAIEWPGPVDRVESLVTALAPAVSGFILCLDVESAVSPKLGLECPARSADGHDRLLEVLTARGLCDPGKAAALSAWEMQEPPDPHRQWPATLIRQSLLLPPDRFVQLTRAINHFKVILSPEQSWSAKAYLWFGNRAFAAACGDRP